MKEKLEKSDLCDLMNYCSPVVSENPTLTLDYNDESFKKCCQVIYWYRQCKRDYPYAILVCYTNYAQRGGIINYSWAADDEPFFTKSGKFNIKPLFIDNYNNQIQPALNYIGMNTYELDDFMIKYVHYKFNYPIWYIKSYMRLKHFDL